MELYYKKKKKQPYGNVIMGTTPYRDYKYITKILHRNTEGFTLGSNVNLNTENKQVSAY